MHIFQKEKLPNALSCFKEALDFWPKDAQAWMALGNCYDEMHKPKNAEKCLRRALQYTSDNNKVGIRFKLANSLLDQNKLKAAIELFRVIPKESGSYKKAQKNLLIATKYLTGTKNETSPALRDKFATLALRAAFACPSSALLGVNNGSYFLRNAT